MITVTGTLQEITSSASTNSFVRFWLRGTGGNQPFVSGTALLAPDGGNTWYADLAPNGSGAVSGTLYSTSDVTVGGVTGAIWYGMQVYQNGYPGPESPVSAAGNININNPDILSVLPVVSAPTGDSTYLRLNGANSPVTGAVTFSVGINTTGITDSSSAGFNGKIGGTTPSTAAFTGINQVFYAGPGATPTIDTAVTACGVNPCTVYISPTYSGADSSLLISMTGTGYKYYNGPSNVSIVDLRASTDITINYPMKFGGKSFAQFSRFGVTQNCASPTDSCVGAVFANVVSGTMPNTGSQTGGVSTLITTGTLNTSSGQAFIGHESFVSLQHTGGSTPNIPNAYGYTSSINLEGSGTSTFTVARAVGYTATTFTNTRTNATAAVAYGFDALAQTIGTSENYGYHNWGNWLSDNGTSFDWADTGGSPRHIITVTNDTNSKTIFQNANDTAGTEFETIGGSGLFHVGSGLLISRTLHQFTNGGIALTAPWVSTVAPTISSGFGTSPSIAKSNGTGAFTINVGTGGTATNGVIALPTITNAWKCTCNDITTQSTTVFMCKQKASSASSATIANYNTSGAEAAWVASDIVQVSCVAY